MTDSFVAYWKRQQALHREQAHQASQQARRDLPLVVQLLREQYSAQKIVLFGSLAKGTFTAESDIDLAVAGLQPGDFFEAYAAVNRQTQFKVDLKPLESLHSHFYRRVMEQGEVLYEASESG